MRSHATATQIEDHAKRKWGGGTSSRDDLITTDFIGAYRALHQLGVAHSVEVHRDGRLVAGLYGVDIDGVFSGESMFHVESDVAKLAFWILIERLRDIGREFIDTQMAIGLAKKWGAELIPRAEFETRRQRAGLSFTPFPR